MVQNAIQFLGLNFQRKSRTPYRLGSEADTGFRSTHLDVNRDSNCSDRYLTGGTEMVQNAI